MAIELRTELDTLKQQKDELIARLEKGGAIIEQEKLQGLDVSTKEDFWISLLKKLERVYDRIRELEGPNQGIGPDTAGILTEADGW